MSANIFWAITSQLYGLECQGLTILAYWRICSLRVTYLTFQTCSVEANYSIQHFNRFYIFYYFYTYVEFMYSLLY